MQNKRFLYAIVAIICVSVVTVCLKYASKDYVTLVGIITGIFTIGQTYTDSKKISKKENS